MFRLTDPLLLFPLALAARLMWAMVRPSSRAPFPRMALDAVFMTYVVSLAKIVLGFTQLGALGDGFAPWAHINLVPLGTISEVLRPDLAAATIGQTVGNILLFVPLGVLLPAVMPRYRTLKTVLVTGLLVSVGIEIAQLGFLLGGLMDRAADIDDVILNTVGTVLGYALWALLAGRIGRRSPQTASSTESAV